MYLKKQFFFPLNVLIILSAFCPQFDCFDKNVKGVTSSISGTVKTSQGSLTKSICFFVHCPSSWLPLNYYSYSNYLAECLVYYSFSLNSAAAAAKSRQSCLTVRPHRRQSTRLHHPWDSPGKNTGVGCCFLLQCMKVKSESEVAWSCLTLSDPMDWSLPAPPSMGFSRQEYWSGVPLPSPRGYTTSW